MSEAEDNLERMLSELFGPEGARQMLERMRMLGLDPAQASTLNMFPTSPIQMQLALAEVKNMMAGFDGPVNWQFAQRMAGEVLARGDVTPTVEQADRARLRLQTADLWLDAVTEIVSVPLTRQVWSRSQWLERTLPVWKQICEPIATNLARAMSEMIAANAPADLDFDGAELDLDALPENLREQFTAMQSMFGSIDPSIKGEGADGAAAMLRSVFANPQAVISRLAGSVFGVQMGRSLAQIGQNALGVTDGAIPLIDDSVAVLIPANMRQLSADIEIDPEAVEMYVAVREAARARLFAAVPWLRAHLFGAIEAYAKQIEINREMLDQAMANLHAGGDLDPTQLDNLNLFATQSSPAQEEARLQVQTLVATIEGWVEVVTNDACIPHLPQVYALQELMRRGAVGRLGISDVLAELINVEIKPSRIRQAAQLWRTIGTEKGIAQRDRYWSHPDIFPAAQDLDDPAGFLDRASEAAAADADIDAELSALLDGTLGWAEGLGPDQDTAGDAGEDPTH